VHKDKQPLIYKGQIFKVQRVLRYNKAGYLTDQRANIKGQKRNLSKR